ncbi:MAG TPA: ParB/RepB/Spo0J family partition protein [Chloroflexia bacterium]|nr:ParB/RepB/Spo0J family partition protein [Chloroflexia bacterium]
MSRSKGSITNKDVFSDLKIKDHVIAGLKPKNRLTDDGDPLEEARLLPLEQVEPNPDQPRKKMNPEQDAELVADILERGILQPLIVRPHPEGIDGHFQIIAGERRWRAAQKAGLEEVPVLIKDFDDQEAKLVALVENLQRVNLDPVDEAEYFRNLSNEFNLSNRQIARLINRSHAYVNDRMKLGANGLAAENQESEQDKGHKKAEPTVRERPAPLAKTWRYRPQNFQRLSSYIEETLENWEQIKDEKSREAILHDISALREELDKLEKKLHVKTKH